MPASKKTSKTTSPKTPRARKTVRRSSVRKTVRKKTTSSTSPAIDYDSLTRSLTTPDYDEIEQAGHPLQETEELTSPILRGDIKKFDYTHELIPTNNHPNPRGRNFLIAGVLGFFLIIFGLWVWNLKTHLASITFAAGPDRDLFTETKQSWNKAFADVPPSPTADTQKLQEAIQTVFSSSTSSTLPTPSSEPTLSTTTSPTNITTLTTSTPATSTPPTSTPIKISPPTSTPQILPMSKPRKR